MADELFINIKKELIKLFKNGNTLAGTNVRAGKTIALNDIYTPYVTDSDIMPLLVLQMKKLQYEDLSQRAQYKRNVDFQIDGYLMQNFNEAEINLVDIETQQDNDLDLFCSQIMQIVTFNTLLKDSDTGVKLCEIFPDSIVKNEITNASSSVLGSVSLRITAVYQQDREFETFPDLADSFNSATTGPDGTVTKEIKLEV